MISVIIPTYNRGYVISRAIESVLAQTYKNYEILVIDDGSTDNTPHVLEKYKDRIRYFYQPNSGLSSARNFGLREVRGKYICFLDSDDIILPDKFKIQIDYFRTHPFVDIVYSGWKTYESDDKKYLLDDIVPNNENDMLYQLIFIGNRFPVHAALIRKKCVQKIGFFDEGLKVCEDKDFWQRMAIMGLKFGYTSHYVCEYMYSPDSLSKKEKEVQKTLENLFQRALDHPALPKRIIRHIHETQAIFLFNKALVEYSKDTDNPAKQFRLVKEHLQNAELADPEILIKNDAIEKAISHKSMQADFQTPFEYLDMNLPKIIPPSAFFIKIKKNVYARTYINLAFQNRNTKNHKKTLYYLFKGIYNQPKWLTNRGVLATLFKNLFYRTVQIFSP